MKSIMKKLAKTTIQAINNVYEKNPKNSRILFNVLEEMIIDSHDLEKTETLLKKDAFLRYLKRSRNFSKVRFESTISKLIKKSIQSTDSAQIENIIVILLTKKYKDAMNLYFKAPVDYPLYDIFESEVFRLAEQSKEAAINYLGLSNEYILKDLKAVYADKAPNTFLYFITLISNILLLGKSFEDALYIARLFIDKIIRFYVFCFEHHPDFNKEAFHAFFMPLFRFMNEHSRERIATFMTFLNMHRMYLIPSIKSKDDRIKFVIRTLHILTHITGDDLEIYTQFIKKYQYKQTSRLLWKTLYKAEPEKLSYYLNFYVSPGFIRFYIHYSYNPSILSFLLKHITLCITETPVSGFPDSLLPIALKLFMDQKVDMRFLKRRTEFSEWLQKRTTSARIEVFFIRMLFYEYIFLFKKWFKEENGITLTRHMDPLHHAFCITLDEKITRGTTLEEREKLYEQLYLIARSEVWKSVYDQLPGSVFEIKVLSGIAGSLDLDDLMLEEIEKVEQPFFIHYYNGIMDTITRFPDTMERIAESIIHDFWCRVYFEQARIYSTRIILPTIGNYPCYPDHENNLAFTDGKSIHLPAYISLFQDDPGNVTNNRNITFYVALALHETGHIIGGTFKFDITRMIRRLEYPFLYKYIVNCFEDFRVEAYLLHIHAHPQAEDIIRFMNIKLCSHSFDAFIPDFLSYISNMAGTYFEDIISLNPDMAELPDRLYKEKVHTGRFTNMRTFIEYGIERLKHMEILNPLSPYVLANEFYEIMKCWPEDVINDIEQKSGPKQGWEGTGSSAVPGNRILSREELERLYEQCNADSRQFYREFEIPIYPGTFGPENSSGKKRPITGSSPGKPDTGPGENTYTEELLAMELHYDTEGTFDLARHTKADREGATRQKQSSILTIIKGVLGSKQKKAIKKKTYRKKRILSLNRDTKTRSIVKECREYEVHSVSPSFLAENKKYTHISRNIYKRLADLMENRAHDTCEHSPFIGDIDMDMLIECLADPQNRHSTDFLEYTIEHKKTLKVIIGLDISGSTSLPISGEIEGGETILDVEKHFALIFADALKLLTDTIDVYGFNSFTSTNIYHALPIEALSGFISDNGNRDGDFIRYINYIFSEAAKDINYFFLISDGMPNSVNYEGKYALDDTLIAMRESREQNIRLIYFNIDSELREYFGYFKEEALYAEYFSDPHQLIDAIPELVMSIAEEVV